MKRRTLLGAAALMATLPAVPVLAQAPALRIVVPYPPGGPLDVVARALAERVRGQLGSVMVENRPGAGGNLGAEQVARSAPDGKTLVMGAVATHAINPWLYKRVPYDPIRDFTPVALVARIPNVLVVNAEVAQRLNLRSVADLVAYTRRNPGRLNYGSGGNGSAGHLAGELFKSMAGVSMVHIPYAGGAPALQGLVAGQVDLSFDNIATVSAQVRAGRLVPLAVTTQQRAATMPDVPALSETLKGFDLYTWFGLFGPAGVPAETVSRLNAAFNEAMATPELRELFGRFMAEPSPATPDAFAQFVRAEHARYQEIVKLSRAQID